MANIPGSILVTGLAAPSDNIMMCDSTGNISWGRPSNNLLMRDEITGEIYELIVSNGKLDIRATSKQGIRQQKIDKIVEDE
jgi:hypothetical protein